MAISDKLTQVNQCKTDIKNSLINIVDSMNNIPFTGYSEKIDEVGSEVNTQVDLINQIIAALQGKAVGGSGESTGGGSMEDGFTVNFHDLDSKLIATSSAECGRYVAELPNHDYDGWADSDGNDYTDDFPLTNSTAGTVINLFAWMKETSLVDLLYDEFGVDKTIYPYVIASLQVDASGNLGSYLGIGFMKSYTFSGNYIKGIGMYASESVGAGKYTDEIVSNSSLAVNYIISKKSIITLTEKTTSSHFFYADRVIYTNFDASSWTVNANYAPRQMQYRLDR